MLPPSPVEEERAWLLEQLRRLVERRGLEPLVAAPLIVADERCFPDPWTRDAEGVLRLVRRMVDHAGLPDLRVVIRDQRRRAGGAGEVGGRLLTESELGLAVVQPDRVVFELHAIGNDDLAGIVSHEVGMLVASLPPDAAADGPYRARPVEELAEPAIGSVAAVYVGLGVLAANASLSRRVEQEVLGNSVYSESRVAYAGGLAPEAIAYLLAVQAELRGGDDPAHRALSVAQRRAFDAWRGHLAGRRQELIDQLRLPPAEGWPPARTVVLAPDVDERGEIEGLSDEDRRLFNRGRWIFRVRKSRASLGLALGTAAGLIGMAMVGASALAALPLLGGMSVGGLAGRRAAPRWRCSDPDCDAMLEKDAPVCRGCGGTVGGELRRAEDRLGAEEDLLASRGAPPAPDAP